jgi:hypothetical protein
MGVPRFAEDAAVRDDIAETAEALVADCGVGGAMIELVMMLRTATEAEERGIRAIMAEVMAKPAS